MNNTGIIVEYNPFHNGHKYHINKSKEITNADNIIAIMSSSFVQRGEPAICDKWTRAKSALLNGVDIVIELPVLYSCSSAESFAFNALKILDSTNIINSICFGSECGNINKLKKLANLLNDENEEYKIMLKNELKKGISFPVARENVLLHFENDINDIIKNSNNILAIEYIKAINKLKSSIKPFTFNRIKSKYNSIEISGNFSSATAIRNLIKNKDLSTLKKTIPQNSFDLLLNSSKNGTFPVYLNNMSDMLNYCLRCINKNDLNKILDINEGIENRILNSLSNCYSISEIADYVKSKRYTYTKIQRTLLHIILNIYKEDLNYFQNLKNSCYIRILGFKKEKQYLLKELVKNSNIPIITNVKKTYEKLDNDAKRLFDIEIKATNLWYMCVPNKKLRLMQMDFKNPIVII